MFHEAYCVTSKSSRLVELLQLSRNQPTGFCSQTKPGETWSPSKLLAYLFILRFERYCIKPNTVPRLKSKYLAPPKIWAGYVTGSAFLTLRWFKLVGICIRVNSFHKSDTSESTCNLFIRNRFHVVVTLHTLSPENCKQYLTSEKLKSWNRAENAKKFKNEI